MKPEALCVQFLTWQCRLRQIAMRENDGRPNQGMCAQVSDLDGNQLLDAMVTLLVRENSFESTEFLKFQVQKYNDPQEVFKKALIYLQSTHYHRAIEFSDEMTALFKADSPIANRLIETKHVILNFAQFSQNYRVPCAARLINPMEPAHQATLWHNRVFNPNLGDDVMILAFQPDWDVAVELLENPTSNAASR